MLKETDLTQKSKRYITLLTVGLAYFANVFCVNLTYVFKNEPFLAFGIASEKVVSANNTLLIFQHMGILIGVLLFGFFADKKGRMRILFVSVFTYSIGTLLGAVAPNFEVFVFLRFLVGLGLAAELGIGLVLICEIFPKSSRPFLVMFVAICGFLGMFTLGAISSVVHWKNLYMIGGFVGLLVMLLRFSTYESDIFIRNQKQNNAEKNILFLLKENKLYFLILSILPTYLITASSVFVGSNYFKELKVSAGQSLVVFSLGAGIGFVLMAYIGRKLKSRVKLIKICLSFLLVLSFFYAFGEMKSGSIFLLSNFLFGFFVSYQFELLTLVVEQFGTNIRATATAFVFGMGRASVFLFSILIPLLNFYFTDVMYVILFLDCIVFLSAFWAISQIKESYNRDLEFVE